MSLENVRNVVLVLSGKGGVGKSSITTQLALCLSLAGKSVGVLDVDLTGPSIPRLFGLENAKVKQAPGGWLPVEVHPLQMLDALRPEQLPPKQQLTEDTTIDGHSAPSDRPIQEPYTNGTGTRTQAQAQTQEQAQESASPQSLPPSSSSSSSSTKIGSLHAISLAFLLPSRSSAVIWRGPKKTAMVRQFLTDVLWPPSGIDYLLIDTPPGTSDEHIALAETLQSCTTPLPSSSSSTTTTTTTSSTPSPSPSSSPPFLAGAVIITTPQAISTADVRKELNFCLKTAIPVLGVVENMAGFICECCGEESNLFGKGGGEVMARDFNVRFLGRVSLDAAWGRLVEEGRRPRYDTEVVARAGDDGDEEDEDQEMQDEEMGDRQGGKVVANGETNHEEILQDDALLVDKYRSCRLFDSMSEITRQIVERIEIG